MCDQKARLTVLTAATGIAIDVEDSFFAFAALDVARRLAADLTAFTLAVDASARLPQASTRVARAIVNARASHFVHAPVPVHEHALGTVTSRHALLLARLLHVTARVVASALSWNEWVRADHVRFCRGLSRWSG